MFFTLFPCETPEFNMLVKQSKFGIPIHKYYFAEADSTSAWWHHLIPTAYMDCYSKRKPFLFTTEYRHTLLTDLNVDVQTIFQNFPKDTRSQILRYEQNPVFELNLQTDPQLFRHLYNDFAQIRGLSTFTCQDAKQIGAENYCIFSIDQAQKPLICHFYLLSPHRDVINLLISASTLAYQDQPDMRRLMGHANRYLHWQGMLYFKAAGYQTYDWSGYVVDSQNPVIQGINRFKRTFNGTLTPIYNHYSPSYALIEKLRQFLRQ